MTQPKPKLKFTVRDYMSMPGDKRYQLMGGEMVLTPSPTDNHQRIVANLFRLLDLFVSSERLGRVRLAPLDVVLSENDVVHPDVMFVSNARSNIITEANVQGAPDLVVEVISPGTADFDRGYKRVLYARHGVREYWLIDPEAESVEVMVLGANGLESVGVSWGQRIGIRWRLWKQRGTQYAFDGIYITGPERIVPPGVA